jgi:hypothetical protein
MISPGLPEGEYRRLQPEGTRVTAARPGRCRPPAPDPTPTARRAA